MRKIKFLFALVAFMMCVCMKAMNVVWGNCGKNGDNVTYVLDTNGLLTIEGSGEMSDAHLCYKFEERVRKIQIGEGVTYIGKGNFSYFTMLSNVVIPTSVTIIGENAFQGDTSLEEINIPNSVLSIGKGAFNLCRGITNVNIPNSVKTIGEGAFEECTSLTSVSIPNSVTSIGQNAFLSLYLEPSKQP